MDIFSVMYLECNALACIVLGIVYFKSRRQTLVSQFSDMRVFRVLILCNFCILLLDSIMLLSNGRLSFSARVFNRAATYAYYFVQPIFCSVWMLYCDIKLYARRMKDRALFFLPALILYMANLVNIFVPFLYTIDAQNLYSRGIYIDAFALLSNFCLLFPAICIALRVILRKDFYLHIKLYSSLLTFVAVVFFCSYLQMRIPGYSFIWTGTTVVMLVIFIGVQNEQIDTDPLTGLYNRRQLMKYINGCILRTNEGKKTYIIMADMDEFKMVNDTYGHSAGDDALRSAAAILRQSTRSSDFVARYGGDEFVIVTRCEKDTDAEGIVGRIEEQFHRYNEKSEKPYQLLISIGLSIYDSETEESADAFLSRADAKMYTQKAERKKLRDQAAIAHK